MGLTLCDGMFRLAVVYLFAGRYVVTDVAYLLAWIASSQSAAPAMTVVADAFHK